MRKTRADRLPQSYARHAERAQRVKEKRTPRRARYLPAPPIKPTEVTRRRFKKPKKGQVPPDWGAEPEDRLQAIAKSLGEAGVQGAPKSSSAGGYMTYQRHQRATQASKRVRQANLQAVRDSPRKHPEVRRFLKTGDPDPRRKKRPQEKEEVAEPAAAPFEFDAPVVRAAEQLPIRLRKSTLVWPGEGESSTCASSLLLKEGSKLMSMHGRTPQDRSVLHLPARVYKGSNKNLTIKV